MKHPFPQLRGRLEQPPETRERGEAGRGQKQAGARVSTKQGEVAMTAEASSQVDSKVCCENCGHKSTYLESFLQSAKCTLYIHKLGLCCNTYSF